MAHIQMFDAEILYLVEEIYKHPPLAEQIRNQESAYVEDQVATVCTYLGIAIDSDLDPTAFMMLCKQLTKELYEKRTGVVVAF